MHFSLLKKKKIKMDCSVLNLRRGIDGKEEDLLAQDIDGL